MINKFFASNILFLLTAIFSTDGHARPAIKLSDNPLTPFLGAAYQSDKESLLGGNCLNNSNVVHIGEAHSSFSFQENLSEKQLQSQLGFSAGAKVSYGVMDYSASASFLKNAMSTGLSVAASWESDYLFPADSLQVSFSDRNATGNAVFSNGNWPETCGDQFVKEITRGARLFFSINIEFKSAEEKKAFQGKFSVSGPLAEVTGSLQDASKEFSRNTKVTVAAYQVGGDVSKITDIFAQTEDGRSGFVQCQLGKFEDCSKVISHALKYATDTTSGFPSQLKLDALPGPAVLGFKTVSYKALGIYIPNYPQLTAETLRMREKISEAFQDQYKLSVNVGRLLNGKNLGDRLARLQTANGQIEDNLTLLLSLAKVCYETPIQCVSNAKSPGNWIEATGQINLKLIDKNTFIAPSFVSLCQLEDTNLPIRNTLVKIRSATGSENFNCELLEQRMAQLTELNLEGLASSADEIDLRLIAPFHQLMSLNLSGNRINDISTLGDLDALKQLDLSNNQISKIEVLSLLSDLKYLNLSLNQISDVSALSSLDRLQKLFLRSNVIKNVDVLIFFPKLEMIDFRSNPLTPDTLKNFKTRFPSSITLLF